MEDRGRHSRAANRKKASARTRNRGGPEHETHWRRAAETAATPAAAASPGRGAPCRRRSGRRCAPRSAARKRRARRAPPQSPPPAARWLDAPAARNRRFFGNRDRHFFFHFWVACGGHFLFTFLGLATGTSFPTFSPTLARWAAGCGSGAGLRRGERRRRGQRSGVFPGLFPASGRPARRSAPALGDLPNKIVSTRPAPHPARPLPSGRAQP